jgi:hypothetical protein
VNPPRDRRPARIVEETVQTPPSSLDMDRHSSAVRSGRAALRKSLKEHTGMAPELTGGDTDGNLENAVPSLNNEWADATRSAIKTEGL